MNARRFLLARARVERVWRCVVARLNNQCEKNVDTVGRVGMVGTVGTVGAFEIPGD